MLNKAASTYEEMYASFHWNLPERVNIAYEVCDKHVGRGRVALIELRPNGSKARYTFEDIQNKANRFANLLTGLGGVQGDRVLIVLGQELFTPVCHIGCWKSGLISVPSSGLFGVDGLTYRLNDSGARFAVTNREHLPKLLEAAKNAEGLEKVFVVDGPSPDAINLPDALAGVSAEFTNLDTHAEDPAFMTYTSGTTGWPKGGLHAHRGLLGHIPALEMVLDFPDPARDVMWAPIDWSWLAGLANNLMGLWYFGVPVVASRSGKFDPDEAYETLEKCGVTISILVPTALKMMRQVSGAADRSRLRLRVVASGGEAVGAELLEWTNAELAPLVIETFGQTENNIALVSHPGLMQDSKIGALGKSTPGQVVRIVDDEGHELSDGKVGNIAFRAGCPIQILEYWNKPEATEKKYAGDWMLSGDLGYRDEDGFIWYQGRSDDVITSSGYRIGPGEIEDALLSHHAVMMSAVIGVPHPVKTEEIKAIIVLNDGVNPSEALKTEISNHVAERLARHERPRIIEFVDSLPMTVTGKVQRNELRKSEAVG